MITNKETNTVLPGKWSLPNVKESGWIERDYDATRPIGGPNLVLWIENNKTNLVTLQTLDPGQTWEKVDLDPPKEYFQIKNPNSQLFLTEKTKSTLTIESIQGELLNFLIMKLCF